MRNNSNMATTIFSTFLHAQQGFSILTPGPPLHKVSTARVSPRLYLLTCLCVMGCCLEINCAAAPRNVEFICAFMAGPFLLCPLLQQSAPDKKKLWACMQRARERTQAGTHMEVLRSGHTQQRGHQNGVCWGGTKKRVPRCVWRERESDSVSFRNVSAMWTTESVVLTILCYLRRIPKETAALATPVVWKQARRTRIGKGLSDIEEG